jgi:hypothetical protein
MHFTIPASAIEYGFRIKPGGAHAGKSMMLPEVRLLFAASAPDTDFDGLRRLVCEENVLLKGTLANRAEVFNRLGDLYGLREELPLYRAMRALWEAGEQEQPLLALLCAVARDSILRATAPVVLTQPEGAVVAPAALAAAIEEAFPERYGPKTRLSMTGDSSRAIMCFWELGTISDGWCYLQSTVSESTHFGGRENVILWGDGVIRELANAGIASIQEADAWNRRGVAVSLMGALPETLYSGTIFDYNVAVIWVRKDEHLPAVWAFCQSLEFSESIRRIDQALKVMSQTLLKVPFDLARWQQVAADQYPDGLPEPHSDDPTQWLFHGHPARSTNPLHVAVARLLGYRWPEEKKALGVGACGVGDDELEGLTDGDGIVCLPAVAGELPAAERLRALLVAAYEGAAPNTQHPTPNTPSAPIDRLLADAGYGGQGLDVWRRHGFFAQHCRLFHNRPFLWHVWDGRKDGFSAIVNYHRLDWHGLQRLTYMYLGAWISAQRDADANGAAGANARLVAALALQEKLKAIADGEPPYDIYVRWKPLHKQPIGWEPDLNDGVRLNIRPFVTEGVLRAKFSVNWNKDRGTNADGSERFNDRHFTRADKETI